MKKKSFRYTHCYELFVLFILLDFMELLINEDRWIFPSYYYFREAVVVVVVVVIDEAKKLPPLLTRVGALLSAPL